MGFERLADRGQLSAGCRCGQRGAGGPENRDEKAWREEGLQRLEVQTFITPPGPSGGINMGTAMTFGYIAGRHVAGATDTRASSRRPRTTAADTRTRLPFSVTSSLPPRATPRGREALGMTSLRRRVSDWLLEAGATMALDCQEMWRKSQRRGARTPSNGDLQVLFLLDLVSTTAIRLGMIIMPARLPHS